MKQTVWFEAKRYGWGWGLPKCWQGWPVLVIYISLVSLSSIFLREGQHLAYAGSIAFLTAILILVCWLKGETPRWRWGNKA